MPENNQPIGTDATVFDILTQAVRDLLNRFPGLEDGEEILYETLAAGGGIAFSNNAGALVYTDREDRGGNVRQTCRYPFFVVYRAAEAAREAKNLSVQEFLDTLGKWVCGEPVTIHGVSERLTNRPVLTNGRRITRITRDNLYASDPGTKGIQDWVLPVTVEYTNEFERW